MRLARIVVGSLFAFVLLAAPETGSAAVTLGQTDTAGGIVCSSGLEVDVQRGTAPATPGYAAPTAGVITQWADAGNGSSTGHVKLKVYRPPSSSISNTFMVVGEGATESIPATKSTSSFPVRIPVRAGDVLGLLAVDGNPSCVFGTPSTSDLLNDEFPGTDDPPGSTTTAGTRIANERVNVSARLEADADGDAFGDESQDACPGLPGSVAGCPRADLALTASAAHGSESDLVTYTLVAGNNGPDAVPDAAISDTLPSGATFLSATGPCSGSGRSVNCSVGALGPGGTSMVTITARLRAGGNQLDTATVASAGLTLAASRASGAGDANSGNNAAGATISVSSPSVSSVKAVPSLFRLGSLLPRISRRRPAVGTTISFRLSEPSRATLSFAQPRTGRRVGRRCRTLTRANRRKPKCTIPNVRGTLALSGHAGTNRVRFQGRLSRTRRLKPGAYVLTITATDSAGNRSRPRSISFTIVR